MVVPIQDKGDAVLIVPGHMSYPIMGYVTGNTLERAFKRKLSICEWRKIVDLNLSLFEEVLTKKIISNRRTDKTIKYVEITILDLPTEASTSPITPTGSTQRGHGRIRTDNENDVSTKK